MESYPLVSVVIPTFNRPGMLKQALDSVRAQSYGRLEIIVSDNGNSDEAAQVALSSSDARIAYIANTVQKTMLRNIVDGLRVARGEFVMTLHDDDFWHPNLVESLVTPMIEDSELIFAFADHWVVDVDGVVDPSLTSSNSTKCGRTTLAPGRHDDLLTYAIDRQAVPMSISTMLRARHVPWSEMRDEASSAYDLWLTYMCLGTGRACFYVPERLAYYRSHGGSETATAVGRLTEARDFILSAFIDDPRLAAIRSRLLQKRAGSRRVLGRLQLEDNPEVARELFRASILDGVSAKGAIGVMASFLPAEARRWVALHG